MQIVLNAHHIYMEMCACVYIYVNLTVLQYELWHLFFKLIEVNDDGIKMEI